MKGLIYPSSQTPLLEMRTRYIYIILEKVNWWTNKVLCSWVNLVMSGLRIASLLRELSDAGKISDRNEHWICSLLATDTEQDLSYAFLMSSRFDTYKSYIGRGNSFAWASIRCPKSMLQNDGEISEWPFGFFSVLGVSLLIPHGAIPEENSWEIYMSINQGEPRWETEKASILIVSFFLFFFWISSGASAENLNLLLNETRRPEEEAVTVKSTVLHSILRLLASKQEAPSGKLWMVDRYISKNCA